MEVRYRCSNSFCTSGWKTCIPEFCASGWKTCIHEFCASRGCKTNVGFLIVFSNVLKCTVERAIASSVPPDQQKPNHVCSSNSGPLHGLSAAILLCHLAVQSDHSFYRCVCTTMSAFAFL